MNVDEIEKTVSYTIVLIFVVFFIIGKLFDWETRDIVKIFNILLVIVIILVVSGMALNKTIANKKQIAGIDRLKEKGYYTELRLDLVHETQEGLLIVAAFDIGKRHYKFLSYYTGDAGGVVKLIEDHNIQKIKIWVDMLYKSVFEFDLDDLFSKIGMTNNLILGSRHVSKDLDYINSIIKSFKKD